MPDANRIEALCLDIAWATVRRLPENEAHQILQVAGKSLAEILAQELFRKLTEAVVTTSSESLAADLLHGADAIAGFAGLTARQVYRLAEQEAIPVFRMGATLCARRSTWIAWIESQERVGWKAGV